MQDEFGRGAKNWGVVDSVVYHTDDSIYKPVCSTVGDELPPAPPAPPQEPKVNAGNDPSGLMRSLHTLAVKHVRLRARKHCFYERTKVGQEGGAASAYPMSDALQDFVTSLPLALLAPPEQSSTSDHRPKHSVIRSVMSLEDLLSDVEPRDDGFEKNAIVAVDQPLSGPDLAPRLCCTSQVDQLKELSKDRCVFRIVHIQPSRQKVLLPAGVPKLDPNRSAITFHQVIDCTSSVSEESKPQAVAALRSESCSTEGRFIDRDATTEDIMLWTPPSLPSGLHYMASIIEWEAGSCTLDWTSLPSTCYTAPGRQASSSIVHKMLQSMFDCHALPGQHDSVFVLNHSRRAPGADAHPSVQLDALMVLEHHHFVSQTMMSEESSCWVLTEDVMRACKPVMTLSSPSLFFQPSKPSSLSD